MEYGIVYGTVAMLTALAFGFADDGKGNLSLSNHVMVASMLWPITWGWIAGASVAARLRDD